MPYDPTYKVPIIQAGQRGSFSASFSRDSTITIGDPSDNAFKPQLDFQFFGGLCGFSISHSGSIQGAAHSATLDTQTGIVTWTTPHVDFSYQTLPKDADNDYGVFKYDLVLKDLAGAAFANISFDFTSNNLLFHYQPDLTPEEIAKGVIRPDNVVHSYAVYYNGINGSVHTNQNEAEYFRTGKVMHIYRPLMRDAIGNTKWADFMLSGNTFSLVCDTTWLQNATYPVVIDPDFGDTTYGGTSATLANYITAWLTGTGAGENGNGVSITAYIGGNPGAPFMYGLYDDNTSAPSLIAATDEGSGGTWGWYTANFTSPPTIEESTGYILAAHGGTLMSYIRHDNVLTDTSTQYAQTYGGSMPSVLDSLYTNSTRYNLYCTYASAESLTAEQVDDHISLDWSAY